MAHSLPPPATMAERRSRMRAAAAEMIGLIGSDERARGFLYLLLTVLEVLDDPAIDDADAVTTCAAEVDSHPIRTSRVYSDFVIGRADPAELRAVNERYLYLTRMLVAGGTSE